MDYSTHSLCGEFKCGMLDKIEFCIALRENKYFKGMAGMR